MNKPVYSGLSILELYKIVMYESWYGHVKPKCGAKRKLYCMNRDSFIFYTKKRVFIKRFLKISKKDLILQIIN